MKKNVRKTKVHYSILRNIFISMILVFIVTMILVGLSYAQDISLMDLVTVSLFISMLGGLFTGASTAILYFFGKQ